MDIQISRFSTKVSQVGRRQGLISLADLIGSGSGSKAVDPDRF
jgi:hypothetical protein